MNFTISQCESLIMYSCTLLGTNISPFKGSFEDDFFISKGEICDRSLKGIIMIWSTVSSSTLEIIGFTLCWVPSLARFPGLSGCVAKGVHFERDPTSSSTFQVGKVGSGDLVERDEKQRIYSKSLKARYIYIYLLYIYFTIFEMVEWMIGNQQSKVTDIHQMTFWIIFSTRGGASDECHTFTPPVLVEVGGDPKSYKIGEFFLGRLW